jgi:hypothetical protein
MHGNGLEILRPVIESRSGMLSTAYQEYTTDQQGEEGANRPGQTSPAGSTETFEVAEYGVFSSVARVYERRIGVANLEEDLGASPHYLLPPSYSRIITVYSVVDPAGDEGQ